MRVVIAGGKLQGVEACYLARELGWDAVVLDRDPSVPARGLAVSFCQCDIEKDRAKVREAVHGADLIIPAIENVSALKSLKAQADAMSIPMAYDERSYHISRSKKLSNRLFVKLGIPIPRPWPECGFPVIAKPSTASGSQGVRRFDSAREMGSFFKDPERIPPGWVIQEYLEGPSYSLEVFGWQGRYETAQITELEMDGSYDCKRVLAPAEISDSLAEEFEALTLRIARGLGLKGIMDVEVIEHKGALKVLEIDARLPSQTPSAVLHSTGINMVELSKEIFSDGQIRRMPQEKNGRGVVYEHIRVAQDKIEVLGEHMMATAGPLQKASGFFGADVGLTNLSHSRFPWVATLMITGENRKQAWQKRCQVIEKISRYLKKGSGTGPKV
jgi:pyrrolysine biosynthesis protein PylC